MSFWGLQYVIPLEIFNELKVWQRFVIGDWTTRVHVRRRSWSQFLRPIILGWSTCFNSRNTKNKRKKIWVNLNKQRHKIFLIPRFTLLTGYFTLWNHIPLCSNFHMLVLSFCFTWDYSLFNSRHQHLHQYSCFVS